jgi:ABC-type dipeptide/oligopeptide/nickel transport system permease component
VLLGRYLLRRLLLAGPTLLGVLFITFALTRIIPGNPIDRMVGFFVSDERRAEIMREHGLDQSYDKQFVRYLGGLLRGDLGTSFLTSRPVVDDLRQRFPATLELTVCAMTIAVLAAVPLGVASAAWKDSWVDHLGRVLSVIGVSVPVFWFGLVLVYLFFFKLGIAPPPIGRLELSVVAPPVVTGLVTIDALMARNLPALWSGLRVLALPSFVLGFAAMAPLARMARSGMVEALDSPYVRAARAMGLPARTVVVRHALKNALLPVVTMIAVVFGYQLGGVVLIESIFSWPGLGQYAFNAAANADFPAIQGFILYATTIYILLFLVVDVLYSVLDRRVRYQ